MKKLFQNQAVAWILLIAAVALACLWGYSRRDVYEARQSTQLLDVTYYNWINDSAKLLSDDTEKTATEYNDAWNDRYYSVVAVATLPKLNGWTEEDYTRALGEKWGLGAGDMLLLLVKDGDWYVACGDNVADAMTDTQQTRLKQAIDQPYYAGRYDEAVTDFFRQADVFYAQAGISGGSGAYDDNAVWTEYRQPQAAGHVPLSRVILLVVAILVVWAILDRIRYNRYRRRCRVVSAAVPAVSYYPIFWGRPRMSAPPPPPRPSGGYHNPPPPPRPSGGYHNPPRPSSGYHNPPRPSSTARPSSASRPISNSRPASRPAPTARSGGAKSGSSRPGGFGKSGFGGGKR